MATVDGMTGDSFKEVDFSFHMIKRKARTNAGETCDARGKADRESAGELVLFVCSGFTLNGGSLVYELWLVKQLSVYGGYCE